MRFIVTFLIVSSCLLGSSCSEPTKNAEPKQADAGVADYENKAPDTTSGCESGPNQNKAFMKGCEPQLPTCDAPKRLAESYRGTFGSKPEDGSCQTEWPAPILSECTEPLPVGVPDLRGLWTDSKHSERVEQCGNLVIIVGKNFVHGGYATGLVKDGVDDYNAVSNCKIPIKVALSYKENALHFINNGKLVITRTVEKTKDGVEELVWRSHLGGSPTELARMRRVCKLSDIKP